MSGWAAIRKHMKLIINLLQTQPARRRGRPGEPAVPGFEDHHHILRLESSCANLQERANKDAHHVLQKPGAVEGKVYLIFTALDRNGIHETHGRFLHLRISAKALKIVFRKGVHDFVSHLQRATKSFGQTRSVRAAMLNITNNASLNN